MTVAPDDPGPDALNRGRFRLQLDGLDLGHEAAGDTGRFVIGNATHDLKSGFVANHIRTVTMSEISQHDFDSPPPRN